MTCQVRMCALCNSAEMIHGPVLGTCFLAGIWCENDVGSTSMRRHHVASTLIRRHFDTKCPLGGLDIGSATSPHAAGNTRIIVLTIVPKVHRVHSLVYDD